MDCTTEVSGIFQGFRLKQNYGVTEMMMVVGGTNMGGVREDRNSVRH